MKKETNCKIIIATHKSYDFPQDDCYLPIHVGRILGKSFGIQGDDEGMNISSKNPYYSELTALYWGWKNLSCDYIGLAHYRRHFSISNYKNGFDSILTERQLVNLISDNDVIVPRKRKYYITTIYEHYSRCHSREHLDITEEIIKDKYPSYHDNYRKMIYKRSGYMFNMFIMRKDICNEYCSWLFPILEQLEKRIDYEKLSDFDKRLFGRVSERLFNVWLDNYKDKHPGLSIKEINFLYLGQIDYAKKISGFLKAVFLKKKYNKSF
ncbi:Uncharacterised protein [Raoultella planticola]|uniref:DUF4422 domain-containing protein n=2 Tax=Raoultella planticola TaxID=575 RepID=UPI000D8B1AE5|nr:DUF4422 domain-containing protein [Raoultella planticola]SPZ31114.1 Uncharacterised protein [Raoultella planticola]